MLTKYRIKICLTQLQKKKTGPTFLVGQIVSHRFSSWSFQPIPKIWVKLGSFPQFSGRKLNIFQTTTVFFVFSKLQNLPIPNAWEVESPRLNPSSSEKSRSRAPRKAGVLGEPKPPWKLGFCMGIPYGVLSDLWDLLGIYGMKLT